MAALSVLAIMLWLCTLLCLSNVSATILPNDREKRSSTYNYGISTAEIVRRQSAGIFSTTATVTGIHTGKGPNDSVPLRPNILDMQQDSDLWTLYILALDMMQYTDQSQLFSWYQVAGIHGRPYLPWDGADASPGNQRNGYCTHVSILFPTWHRPYMVLYEQLLYNLALEIAAYWPAGAVRDRYAAAVHTFRIPYWDWAAVPPDGHSILPGVVWNSSSIVVDGPNGVQTIANPLFTFEFKPLNPTELPDFPLNQWSTTVRYPTSSYANATSQNDLVALQLDNNAAMFRNRLYNLFTNYPDYEQFSNEAWIPASNLRGWEGYDSIESIHDQIHGLTGSGGHMTYIDYSGFDPIFWLHHAMVDRCFAMWQALYPDSYVTPEPSQYGTFTTSPGQMENGSTHLTPFRNDQQGDFWNADSVRDTTVFGYAYAETANNTTPSLMQARVKLAINKLYGASAPASAIVKIKTKPRELPAKVVGSNELNDRELADSSPIGLPTDLAPNGQYREWIANIRVTKYALSGPFFIHIFLGAFSPNPFDWSFDANLVGSHCIFTRTASSNCVPCQSNQQVSATMPLTSSLLQEIANGSLTSLEPQDVEPFLKQNMQYRISKLDDTAVPNEDVPDLVIEVVSSLVQKPASIAEFPKWGALRLHLNSSTSPIEAFTAITFN